MSSLRPTLGFVGIKWGSQAVVNQCMLHLPTLERRGKELHWSPGVWLLCIMDTSEVLRDVLKCCRLQKTDMESEQHCNVWTAALLEVRFHVSFPECTRQNTTTILGPHTYIKQLPKTVTQRVQVPNI